MHPMRVHPPLGTGAFADTFGIGVTVAVDEPFAGSAVAVVVPWGELGVVLPFPAATTQERENTLSDPRLVMRRLMYTV